MPNYTSGRIHNALRRFVANGVKETKEGGTELHYVPSIWKPGWHRFSRSEPANAEWIFDITASKLTIPTSKHSITAGSGVLELWFQMKFPRNRSRDKNSGANPAETGIIPSSDPEAMPVLVHSRFFSQENYEKDAVAKFWIKTWNVALRTVLNMCL